MDLETMCLQLRAASRELARLTPIQKNHALLAVADALTLAKEKILEENQKDMKAAQAKGVSESLQDRLLLTSGRIDGMVKGIKVVVGQTDPLDTCIAGWKTEEGLHIRQIRVPIGVAAIIYEARPNVTVEAFSLAYKSGNALLLRGSSLAYNTNQCLLNIIKGALYGWMDRGGVAEAIDLVCEEDRSDVTAILNAKGLIDVVLPRGGEDLIAYVVENATIPVIETGSGVCHLYVDKDADIKKAVTIAENAKIQKPSACNSIETILVHADIAEKFLTKLAARFVGRVCMKCDETSYKILESINDCYVMQAEPGDFGKEFLDYTLSIAVVPSLEVAIEFINMYNTKHSETIITSNIESARKFQNEVDAACVYVNASTRFTDGGIFGFGAELGISTQKFHVRGPMGMEALTVTKYLIDGDGQVRER